jgi:phage regulator Rha-like protein
LRAVAAEDLFIPGNCLAASAGPGAEPQGGIPHEHPRKTSPYVNIRTSNRVITLTADLFGRPHKNVLQSLDGLTADGTIDRLDFKPIFYTDEMNREQRAYQLSERAALISMPFIGGKKSREGQRTLVDAFLAARDEINRLRQMHASPAWQQARIEGQTARKAETDVVAAFVQYAVQQGSKSAGRYFLCITRETNRALFFVQSAVGKDFRQGLSAQQLASVATQRL